MASRSSMIPQRVCTAATDAVRCSRGTVATAVIVSATTRIPWARVKKNGVRVSP